MTYSLAIHFFSRSLVHELQSSFITHLIVDIWQNFGILDMVYELSGRKIIYLEM